MIKRRSYLKKQSEEDENRWLITYADMITLLLVFFVVMYSIADVKLSKLNNISNALNKNFNAQSLYSPDGERIFAEGISRDEKRIEERDEKKDEEYIEVKINPLLKELNSMLVNDLADEELGEAVNIELNGAELTVSLNTGKGFFTRGSADINAPTARILDVISETCRSLPESAFLRVEGYTCDLPMKSEKYPSNWELSTARATNVARYLIEEGKFKSRNVFCCRIRPVSSKVSKYFRRKQSSQQKGGYNNNF